MPEDGSSLKDDYNAERAIGCINRKYLNEKSYKMWYPVVAFHNGQRKIIGPFKFSSRLVGIGESIRATIPLKLAWTINIHKSQGMTLDYVKVHLKGAFAKGQAYVALIRASRKDGLELGYFHLSRVRANSRALIFYENPNALFPT